VIVAAIERLVNAAPAALARTILETLWEGGYDVTRQPDVIPIRRNSGKGDGCGKQHMQ
jgi:hypothetical protein